MRIPQEYEEPVHEILELYDQAEADLKTAGRVTNNLCVAAVNQLRYAGQHVVRALATTEEAAIKADLDAARRHALRALYDINDASIQFHLHEIDRIRTTYPVNLNSVVPGYASIIVAVEQASKRVDQVSYHNRKDRRMLYQELRQDVSALTEAYGRLKASLPDIIAAADRHNRSITLAWLSIAATILAAMAYPALSLVFG